MDEILVERMPADFANGNVEPDFIYNRFDLWLLPADFDVIRTEYRGEVYTIEARYEGKEAQLGVWLAHVPAEVLKAVIEQIFQWHPRISKVYLQHSFEQVGVVKAGNHWRVDILATMEEFEKKSSGKTRSTLRRKIRLLEKEIGEEISFREYSVQEGLPVSVMKEYFGLKDEKFSSYGKNYVEHLTEKEIKEYTDAYHVTHLYVMWLGKVMGGAVLSCEQCACVYFENTTYNLQYKKFSPGIIIYDYFLKRMVEKGKQSIFLAGGSAGSYKSLYNGIEDQGYECRYYRSKLRRSLEKVKASWSK